MAERLRIIHCFRAPVGGLFRHVLDLSGEQAARGHEVGYILDSTVSDPLTEARLAKAEGHLTLGIARIPMGRLPGPRDLATSRAVRDIARRLHVDVLHGHGAKGGAYARLAARELRLDGRNMATFYTPHGGSLHYKLSSPQGILYAAIEKFLVRYTDGLIFESDFIRRVYNRKVGARGVPERVIPNALQPGDFAPHQPNTDAADFLFIGELRQLKGVDVLLQAIARLAALRPVRAVIVGAGPDATAFKALAHQLGLDAVVDFRDAMPARAAFALGRSLVVPSRAESMPYIVLEAAAAGIPLLATNVGGIPEIVNGTGTPLMPPGDAEALARAMQGFLDDPEGAKARAERLKTAVAERFTVARAADEVLAFYAERLGR
ncbi:glycosyltransferase family 4 protein [Hyphomicrobium sp.]|uniref:glycosyltransferase family 4 protein n=1 Tax=Hyphomicrobium sp. TaxID=82 RepID=UPI0025C0B545|nr:glycosyltransferase family 4 protein [Hyphomicrobium sp.]